MILSNVRKIAVVDFDDQEDKYDRNGMNFLFYWKAKFPKFKVTMFAIPGRCSEAFLKLLEPYRDWIQLGVHGWLHNTNFEAQYWDYQTAHDLLGNAEDTGAFVKVFRAPGWQLTYPQPYNEYPNPEKPVNSDPTLIYDVLKERGYIITDQHYNKDKRPEGIKIYCTCNPYFTHGHVEDINTGDLQGKNGMRQIQEEHPNLPWDDKTEFKFITELTNEELRCI